MILRMYEQNERLRRESYRANEPVREFARELSRHLDQGSTSVKYRNKPRLVDAVQWRGDNWDEVSKLDVGHKLRLDIVSLVVEPDKSTKHVRELVVISTAGGRTRAAIGDWIVRLADNSLITMGDETFQTLYEKVPA